MMIACPTCATPRNADDAICTYCGFVFDSQLPNAVAAAPLAIMSAPTGDTLLQPGQTLQQTRYTILQPLSRGGMGALYLAHDHDAFDRLVVVKVLLPASNVQTATGANQQRFFDEARMLAALKHPTIPQIFAYFQDGAHTCIVMEYIEGQDLERGLTRVDEATGALELGASYPLADVLRWGALVCRMLDYLARRMPPIVHQDIKPANLVLDTSSDGLFLVDFGTASGHQTANDDAYGTPGYAPLEQYKGQSEPRSDVYALAATLYHLATDDDPRGHHFQFPRLAQLGRFGEALRAALHDDVALRPTAHEFCQQLEGLRAAQPLLMSSSTILRAPDGTQLHDVAALAQWCEYNGHQARIWLYGQLPDQVERLWNNTYIAKLMRNVVQSHGPNTSLALDKLLALLDPQGYGLDQPQLIIDPFVLDLGDLAPSEQRHADVQVRNIGRRYVKVAVRAPSAAWLRVLHDGELALGPGQQVVLHLDIAPFKTYPLPEYLSYTIKLEQEGRVLVGLDVQARIVQGRVQSHISSSSSVSGYADALTPARAGQVQLGYALPLPPSQSARNFPGIALLCRKLRQSIAVTNAIGILLSVGFALALVLTLTIGKIAMMVYVGVVLISTVAAIILRWSTR